MDRGKNKLIISLAPVPAGLPIDKDALAEDVTQSVLEGAGVCHLHSRLADGSLSPNTSYMEACFDAIRDKSSVIVQTSTGGVSDMSIEERCNPLLYAYAESASLNGGSTNLGDFLYINTLNDIRYCADMSYQKNVLPEIEVFDIGMIQNMMKIVKNEEADFHKPLMFNLVFGHRGGMEPTIDSLVVMKSFVPEDAMWGVTHYGRDNWTFLAAAIAMGAQLVRIGFEDSPYLEEDTTADFNYQVVKRLRKLTDAMGVDLASPQEAREILGIKNKAQ